jgi:hypothetical protein
MKFGTLFHTLTGALLLASTASRALPICRVAALRTS